MALAVANPALASGTALPRERVITLHERQWAFAPGIVVLRRGDRVALRLVSDDVTHGFYLDGYGLEGTVAAESPAVVHFVADRPGRFMLRCAVTCGPFHPYMIAWLLVKPDVTAYAGWALVAVAALGSGVVLTRKGWAL